MTRSICEIHGNKSSVMVLPDIAENIKQNETLDRIYEITFIEAGIPLSVLYLSEVDKEKNTISQHAYNLDKEEFPDWYFDHMPVCSECFKKWVESNNVKIVIV